MDAITLAMALAQFAPSILKWVTGSDKAEAVAKQVVEIASAVTGKDGALAVEAIKADPSALLEFRRAIAEVEADMDKQYLADRQDARRRDVAYVQAGKTNRRANLMVAMDAVGLIVCLVVLTMYQRELAGEAVALISTIASIFGLCLRDAHQFEFGSSRSSAEKTQIMARMTPSQTQNN